MRLRLVGLITISLIHAAGAAELDQTRLDQTRLEQARLRGSNADSPGPVYRVAAPSYAGYAAPPPYQAATLKARPAQIAAPPPPPPAFTFEVGARFWYSSGKLSKDLFDDPRFSSFLNSRLTFDGLISATYEGFGRIDTPFGTFIKGNVGLGKLNVGTLNDEDFPPNLVPYSNTLSQQGGGRLGYGSVDLGQIVATSDRARASIFAGYGFLNENVNAFGCNQMAGNPFICSPALPSDLLALSEETHWQFVRLGVFGEIKLIDRFKLSAEVAWLPYVQLNAQDTHWLRLGSAFPSFSGPIPEGGTGTGVQLEALLSYQVTECLNLGVGGRYWYMQTHGGADLENTIVGFLSNTGFAPVTQPLNFVTTRFGGFAQGSYKFGPF